MSKILVFQTDFTYAEGAVASMYGVVKSVDRNLEIIDATHQIPQYDIYSASYRLYQYVPFWPADTVFVSVVDPGVGTSRKACVALLSNGSYVVTPDNGTLSHLDKYFGIKEVRQIDETVNRLRNKDTEEVAVFHGRDLFGYCAARLAAGIISYEEVGPKYDLSEIRRLPFEEPVVYEDSIEGMIEIMDPNFGNLWTNIPKKMFEDFGFKYGDKVKTVITYKGEEVFNQELPYFKSFSYAQDHSLMIYHNELNKIALAEVVGNMARNYNLGYGTDYKVVFMR
ncbi:MAG: SAM-dependent chlorinase/fluorinase [Erysipelotrichaceae bacterium]|nr:SAM-dependent chlorinase/fluorinase [Erysipelotrichaceae bacterium]